MKKYNGNYSHTFIRVKEPLVLFSTAKHHILWKQTWDNKYHIL